MTERDVRKLHSTVGVILSLFIFVQIGTGTLIASSEFLGYGRHVHAEQAQHDHGEASHASDQQGDKNDNDNIIQVIHHYGGRFVQGLRVLLGLGALFMVISGTWIYALISKRTRKTSKD